MIAVALLGVLAGPAARAATPVDAGVRVLIKALSYDHALPNRIGDTLRVGVVFDRTDPLSAAQSVEAAAALRALQVTIGGVPVGEPVLVSTADDGWTDALAGLTVVVACRGIGARGPTLAALAAERDLPLLTLDGASVGTGPAIGVDQRSAHLEIRIDAAAARAQGMELGGELLELATLVPSGAAPR
ncbi:MAG: hypothetical protein ABMB14_02455 [Myxococcota bacterium]